MEIKLDTCGGILKISALDLEDVSVTCKPAMLNFKSGKDSLEHFSYHFTSGRTYADGNKIENRLLGS